MSNKLKKQNFPRSNTPILVFVAICVFALTEVITLIVTHYIEIDYALVLLISYIFSINALTFLLYGVDKQLARAERHRIPEKYLLLFGALGGSLGAILAIDTFRHKTQKTSYIGKFGLILLLQATALILGIYLLTR